MYLVTLFDNRINISLLKQVSETRDVKEVCYHTTSDLIGYVPQEFKTTSRVCITCNSLEGKNVHLESLKTRGFFITFEPTKQEIMTKMQEVSANYSLLEASEKEEVLALIETNANNITNLSLRLLIKGSNCTNSIRLQGLIGKKISWQNWV